VSRRFEWVITDAPCKSMVGRGIFDPLRGVVGRRGVLQLAASLPGLFVIEDADGNVIVRGKCSNVLQGADDHEHTSPLRLARGIYKDAHRVVYKLGDAIMGIYI